MKIERFEDLEVWQLSRKLVQSIYKLTSNSKFSKDFNLITQIRRSAVSIMSNVAEGFERKSKKEFIQYGFLFNKSKTVSVIQFLYTAKGSCGELRSQLYIALDLSYITTNDFNENYILTEQISKSLAGFIKYLKSYD